MGLPTNKLSKSTIAYAQGIIWNHVYTNPWCLRLGWNRSESWILKLEWWKMLHFWELKTIGHKPRSKRQSIHVWCQRQHTGYLIMVWDVRGRRIANFSLLKFCRVDYIVSSTKLSKEIFCFKMSNLNIHNNLLILQLISESGCIYIFQPAYCSCCWGNWIYFQNNLLLFGDWISWYKGSWQLGNAIEHFAQTELGPISPSFDCVGLIFIFCFIFYIISIYHLIKQREN